MQIIKIPKNRNSGFRCRELLFHRNHVGQHDIENSYNNDNKIAKLESSGNFVYCSFPIAEFVTARKISRRVIRITIMAGMVARKSSIRLSEVVYALCFVACLRPPPFFRDAFRDALEPARVRPAFPC